MTIPEDLLRWLEGPVLGNPLWRWAAGLGVALSTWAVLAVLRRALVARLKADGERAPLGLVGLAAAVVGRTHALFLLATGVLAGSLLIEGGEAEGVLLQVFVLGALVQSGLWGTALVGGLLAGWRERKGQDAPAATALSAIGFLAKVGVWSVVLLLSLDNLGVRVSALLAGLGVGGIAVALAVQNILGDLFASVSILLDRPFEIGDFIIVGDLMGTVEHIGIKTTRVRSLSGEQIVFSNGDLLGSRIRNFKRMFERRVLFTLGVTYRTPSDALEAIPRMLKEIVTAQGKVRFDRAHFARFGDSALLFEVVHYVLSPDYNLFMDIQQAVNLAVFKKFKEAGVEFAYPTQTVFLEEVPPVPARS